MDKERLLSDIYKVTKFNIASRKVKRDHCLLLDGFSDANGSIVGLDSPSSKSKPRFTKLKKLGSTNVTATNGQHERMPQNSKESATTPVASVRAKRRTNLLGNSSRPCSSRSRTPHKYPELDCELQSTLSSSSPSPRVLNFPSLGGSGSPLCCSSPGRNCQSSQDSQQDVIWNCASPVNYSHHLPRDLSNIRELCRFAKFEGKQQGKSEHKSLLEVWEKQRSKCLPEEKNGPRNPRPNSVSAPNEIEKLLEMIGHQKKAETESRLSPNNLRTPVRKKQTSPNSSTDELWREEDESFILYASQMSPVLFAEDTQCEDVVSVTQNFENGAKNNSKGRGTIQTTPVGITRTKNPRGEKNGTRSADSEVDALWDDEDDSEVLSQEVLTLIEQQLTQSRSGQKKCTPEEIAKKRQEAVHKRRQRCGAWNGQLRPVW